MASKSKSKGSSWEREVANYLSKLYNESFVRAPGSGAYIGGTNSSRKEVLHEGQIRTFKGDIIPGQSFARLNAECKNYADFGFHSLFTGNNKTLESWIEQCVEVADEGDVNILFIKITRKGTFIAFQQSTTQATQQATLQATNHLEYNSTKHGVWTIMDFERFFSLNSEGFKEICKGAI